MFSFRRAVRELTGAVTGIVNVWSERDTWRERAADTARVVGEMSVRNAELLSHAHNLTEEAMRLRASVAKLRDAQASAESYRTSAEGMATTLDKIRETIRAPIGADLVGIFEQVARHMPDTLSQLVREHAKAKSLDG